MRALFKSQDGIALPVASAMLMVIGILVVGVFTVGLSANEASIADRSSKRALAAAEAGLQTALYRLNMQGQAAITNAAYCLTNTWVAPDGGECPGWNEPLGNGAEYTYYVTPAGATTGCVTIPGVPTSAQDRCITSVGLVNGVRRRVQARVVQAPTIPDFNTTGLVGKSLVYAWNSINLSTDVGSNLRVQLDNSINIDANASINVAGRIKLLQGGQYVPGNSVNVDAIPPTQTVTTPFDMPVPDFEAVETNNNNTLPADLGTAWNETTRRINLSNGERTIRPGTYHVCGVFLGNSTRLRFSHLGGAPTKIYVDSPSRPGSMCEGQADPAGTFQADNSVDVNREIGQREELLRIYLYGTPYNDTRPRPSWCTDLNGTSTGMEAECRSDVMLDNSVNFYGSIYAPNSTVQAHNSVNIWGSVAADKIRFYNSVNFWLTGETLDDPGEGPGAAQRRGWAECRPQPTVATDPESGC